MIYLYAVVSDRKGNIMLQKLYVFFRKETVLSIAVILALLSMFWVRPDKAYFTYIDFGTLGLLFCLMAIVAGLKAVGVFDILAQKLLMGTSGTVGVIRLLVLLCFFLSMVITNDVALITFVPLALIIVHKLPKELGNYWLLKIVAMQTIAANLGSMLTPIGNPQNLYLYARAGMSAAELITLMLPYSATALILLLIWIQVAAAKAPHVCGLEKDKTLLGFSDRKELNIREPRRSRTRNRTPCRFRNRNRPAPPKGSRRPGSRSSPSGDIRTRRSTPCGTTVRPARPCRTSS